MSDSRFTSQGTTQGKTTAELLSTNTVGLVALSDYRKRRVETIEQQEREARETALSGTSTSTPDRSLTGTPDNAGSDPAINTGSTEPVRKKKKKTKSKLLSFDDEDGEDGGSAPAVKTKPRATPATDTDDGDESETKSKFKPNASLGLVPKSTTKAALRKEATQREALRREFVAIQELVKATEIAIPFVFYDGANIPGGIVRMKKGDHVWLFLDKSRKVGAELGVGEKAVAAAQKVWARVGVDDLMIVRGSVIIPHHYDFYFFVVNETVGPGGQRLFNYSAEAPTNAKPREPTTSATSQPDVDTLEGAEDDPTLTKVVDRRWYEKNKHIYPASTWQDFDPEKDYVSEVRRDTGGNTFFFSR